MTFDDIIGWTLLGILLFAAFYIGTWGANKP